LPIITGIGHERDDTVLDFVAAHRAKTPTAVADFLITKMEESAETLFDCQTAITNSASQILEIADTKLLGLISRLPLAAKYLIETRQAEVFNFPRKLSLTLDQMFTNKQLIINAKEEFFRLSSPDYVLAKGYSITTKNGKTIRSAAELAEGDFIETQLANGKIGSKIALTSI